MNFVIVDSDIEGPLVLNDNAFELTVALAKRCGLGAEVGRRFFTAMSRVDDLWGDFVLLHHIDPGYSSGHTLKTILPFLRAMAAEAEVGDPWLYGFSQGSLRTVPGTVGLLRYLRNHHYTRLISTSYDLFIRPFCDAVGFPFESVICTVVGEFEGVPISLGMRKALLSFTREIAAMPLVEFDTTTGVVVPESEEHERRICEIVWDSIYHDPLGNRFLTGVHPVGQSQKRKALEQHRLAFGLPKSQVMYVGDSQTDFQCVEYLGDEGLSVMFNGKGKVCDGSSLMIIGRSAEATELVARVFARQGRQGVVRAFTPGQLTHEGLIAAVTPENITWLKEISAAERNRFRGVQIGSLS